MPFFGNQIPTPPSVLKKWRLWYLLLFLLVVLIVLQLVGVKIFGALLAALTLVFVWLVCRNEFADAGHYVMILALVCSMNLLFDFLRLCQNGSGREAVSMSPGWTNTTRDGWSTTFTRTMKIYPFFDASQGLRYNCHSLAICVSPAVMLLGAFLSIRAWYDIRTAMPDDGDAGYDWLFGEGWQRQAERQRRRRQQDRQHGQGGGYGSGGRAPSLRAEDVAGLLAPRPATACGQVQHLGVQAQKLGGD